MGISKGRLWHYGIIVLFLSIGCHKIKNSNNDLKAPLSTASASTSETDKGEISFKFDAKNRGLSLAEAEKFRNIVLTVNSHETHEKILDSQKIPLTETSSGYLSEPIALPPGDYDLVSFIVTSENETQILVAPVSGSSAASVVDNPLPISFKVEKDQATDPIRVEVTSALNKGPKEFGYPEFEFELVKTIDFVLAVSVYDLSAGSTRPSAAAFVVKGDQVVLTKGTTRDGPHNIRIKDKGDISYEIDVSKKGYKSFSKKFSREALVKAENDPIFVALEPDGMKSESFVGNSSLSSLDLVLVVEDNVNPGAFFTAVSEIAKKFEQLRLNGKFDYQVFFLAATDLLKQDPGLFSPERKFTGDAEISDKNILQWILDILKSGGARDKVSGMELRNGVRKKFLLISGNEKMTLPQPSVSQNLSGERSMSSFLSNLSYSGYGDSLARLLSFDILLGLNPGNYRKDTCSMTDALRQFTGRNRLFTTGHYYNFRATESGELARQISSDLAQGDQLKSRFYLSEAAELPKVVAVWVNDLLLEAKKYKFEKNDEGVFLEFIFDGDAPKEKEELEIRYIL